MRPPPGQFAGHQGSLAKIALVLCPPPNFSDSPRGFLRPSSRLSLQILLLFLFVLKGKGYAQDVQTESDIAPGLTVLSVIRQLPAGPVRFWVVRAERTQGWKLGLAVADPTQTDKKRTVRAIAAQSEAAVAVNGNFFAYGGSAVGAVKAGGEWYRLPWKDRTALAWDDSGAARIDSTSGLATVQLGSITLSGVTLNGVGSSYSYANDNGYALLTPHYGATAFVPNRNVALAIQNGQVIQRYDAVPDIAPADPAAPQGRDVPIPTDGWLLIGLTDTAAATLQVPPGTAASWRVTLNPPDMDNFPTILGAGPRLVARGQVWTTEHAEEFRPDVLAAGPRTAVGWDSEGNWMLLVVDGRSALSVGLDIPDTAALFREFGAIEAMNLDGGSSTQLVIGGQLVNTPSAIDPADPTHPREVMVPNAIILRQGSAEPLPPIPQPTEPPQPNPAPGNVPGAGPTAVPATQAPTLLN